MNGFSAFSGVERRVNTTVAYWGRERRSLWGNPRPDERTLVERAARHDREAFVRLYDRFVDKIYRYVYCRTGEQPVAEAITAQVFFLASQSINRYQWTDRPYAAWLYHLAQKQVADYLLGNRDRTRSVEATLGPSFGAPGADADVIGRNLARLSQAQQLVVILRFVEGYTIEQTARMTGKQPRAIRMLQYRALAAMCGTTCKGPGNL